jgi:hypothetical protein
MRAAADRSGSSVTLIVADPGRGALRRIAQLNERSVPPAIRQSQQTIDETRELMRRLDLVIERERVLKRT